MKRILFIVIIFLIISISAIAFAETQHVLVFREDDTLISAYIQESEDALPETRGDYMYVTELTYNNVISVYTEDKVYDVDSIGATILPREKTLEEKIEELQQ